MQVSSLEKYLLLAAGVCGLILLYLYIAKIQHDVNQDMTTSDQGAYMSFARKAHASGFQHTGDRNRMPLFPWLTALFYSPEMSDREFFETGKQLNVWLSLLVIAALGAAFYARFSRLYAGFAIISIAFLAFVVKSPYFQADLLYYGLFAFAFILSLSTLSAPTWKKSVAVGLLFGLAHFTKASALPALLIFCVSLAILCVSKWLQGRLRLNTVVSVGLNGLLAVMAFLALLFPYLQESFEKYGSHFYNVNTTFYIWYDSWGEARAGTIAAGDHFGYPDLPPEEIPRLEKYFSEHSLQQIVDRFRKGAQTLVFFGCIHRDSPMLFGYCAQVGAGLVMLIFSLPLLLRRFLERQIQKSGHVVFFAFATFFIYAMAAFWYTAITGIDPRFIMVLIVPFFWILGLVVHTRPVQAHRLRFGHLSVSTFHLVYGLLSLSLLFEIYLLASVRAATLLGGN